MEIVRMRLCHARRSTYPSRTVAIFALCFGVLASQTSADQTTSTNQVQTSWSIASPRTSMFSSISGGTNSVSPLSGFHRSFTDSDFVFRPAYTEMLTTPLSNSLVVWWTFEDNGGFTGNLEGDPTPFWTKAVTSEGLSFDCSQNYVDTADAISQTFTAATLECWFQVDSLCGENPTIVVPSKTITRCTAKAMLARC